MGVTEIWVSRRKYWYPAENWVPSQPIEMEVLVTLVPAEDTAHRLWSESEGNIMAPM